MEPLARAAEPSGEKMPFCEEGRRRKGREQGKERAVLSLQRPVSGSLVHAVGNYFRRRHHFAFKPWEKHKPFKILVQLMGSVKPSINTDSWS